MKICGKEYFSKTSIVRRDDSGGSKCALKMDYSSNEVILNDVHLVYELAKVMPLETDDTFDSFSAKGLSSKHDTINVKFPTRNLT